MEVEVNDFPIFCISNACTKSYPENTLTRFVNDLPSHIQLQHNDRWHICIESIGFSTNFSNILLPKNREVPSIKIFSQTIKQSGVFDFEHHEVSDFFSNAINIYLPNQIISRDNLKDIFVHNNEKYKYIEVDFTDDIVSLKYGKHSKIVEFYTLYLHESFVRNFGFEIDEDNSQMISNEKFYKYLLGPRHLKIVGGKVNWEKRYPTVVKVKCDEIQSQIFNNRHTKDLITFYPDFNKNEDFYFIDFEYKQFIPLSNTSLEKISISLVDENNFFIPLIDGCATFIKFQLKKMGSEFESFNVRISSIKSTNHETNLNNDFIVDLPQSYSLSKQWKAAITNISYPSDFFPLPFSKDMRTIYTARIGEIPKSNELKNKSYNESELFLILDDIFTTYNLCRFQTSKNEFGDLICKISMEPRCLLILPKPLAMILGYSKEKNTDTNIEEMYDYVTLFNLDLNNVKVHEFINPVDLECLRPRYLMVYANFIEPSIVAGDYRKLLKVLPIHKTSNKFYKTEEFAKHLEYHRMENTELNKIKISIRAHDGEPVNFKEDKNLFLNILFSNKQD